MKKGGKMMYICGMMRAAHLVCLCFIIHRFCKTSHSMPQYLAPKPRDKTVIKEGKTRKNLTQIGKYG